MAEVYNTQPTNHVAVAPVEAKPLWDPKYAAVGVLSIALAVLLVDLLPRFIAQKMGKG